MKIKITTEKKEYICERYDQFLDKISALNTLHIPFNFYVEIRGEWVCMSKTSFDLFKICNRG